MPLPGNVNADKLPERSSTQVHKLVKCRAEPCGEGYPPVKQQWGGRRITQLHLDWQAASYKYNPDETCPVCEQLGCQLRHRTCNVFSDPDREAQGRPNDEKSPFGELAAAFRAVGCPLGTTPEIYEGQYFVTEDKQIGGRAQQWQTVPITHLETYTPASERPTWSKRRETGGGTATAAVQPTRTDAEEAYPKLAEILDGRNLTDPLLVGTTMQREAPELCHEPYLSQAYSGQIPGLLKERGLGDVDEGGVFHKAGS